MSQSIKMVLVGGFAIALMCPSFALAGGYEVTSQSVEGIQVNNAGSAAGYSDGSAAYFNPAAMTRHTSTTISINGAILQSRASASNNGSTSLLGQPLTGDDHEGEISRSLIPTAYAVTPLTDKLVGGLFLTTPFGLSSKYDSDWIGRYQAIHNELTTIQTGASLAYRLTEALSVGASVSSLYADAKLSNAIDFGSIGVATLGAQTANALGLTPQGSDGLVTIQGSDWAMGWGAGMTYRYGCDERNTFGVAYRASVGLDIHGGNTDFVVPTAAQPLTSTGAFTNTSARTSLTLPEAVTFGATHWMAEDWALLLGSKWTRWSEFDELSVSFENPAQPAQSERQSWRNTWRHEIGVRHVLTPEWTLSSGFAYDASPIDSAENRTARVPEGDQYWGSLGVSYTFSENLVAHLAYQHVWVDNTDSNRVGSGGDTLRASWDNSYDEVGLSFVYKM